MQEAKMPPLPVYLQMLESSVTMQQFHDFEEDQE